jgi:hypothetical protein
VEIGRVSDISASPEGSITTLEFYHRTRLPSDTRFVNFNYSLFGARMVIAVPGSSPSPLDRKAIHRGEFSNGVAETIHRVDELLRTVVEYQSLSSRFEKGGTEGESLADLLNRRIYPTLDEFGRFARRLEELQDKASGDLTEAAAFSDAMNRGALRLANRTDSMLAKTARIIEDVAVLTARSGALLESLEKLMIATADTSRASGKLLRDRELYEKTVSLSKSLHDLIKLVKKEGLEDVIHFWRNVRFRSRGGS